jgi:hypothetical protein
MFNVAIDNASVFIGHEGGPRKYDFVARERTFFFFFRLFSGERQNDEEAKNFFFAFLR